MMALHVTSFQSYTPGQIWCLLRDDGTTVIKMLVNVHFRVLNQFHDLSTLTLCADCYHVCDDGRFWYNKSEDLDWVLHSRWELMSDA